jgi:hypothetical protein
MKNHLYNLMAWLGLMIPIMFSGSLQAQGIVLTPDTIDLSPLIPKTVNILANDLIPPGDSIVIMHAGSSGNILCNVNPDKTVTFTANYLGISWGFPPHQTGSYLVRDVTLDTIVRGGLVFNVNDQSYDSLYLNNINARFDANGSHFFNPGSTGAGFEVPKFSGKHTIFLSTFWIGGLDQNSALHLSAEKYGQGPGPNYGAAHTKFDFWAGPVMDSGAYSIYQDTLWNYVWNLKKTDIEYHKAHWQDAGYQPIRDILTWPGNGNVSLGQAAQLAPYFDRNNDGTYNPLDGDYPMIKGDQTLFFIFNDDRNIHSETQGDKLKAEIQGMAYVFDRPGDSAFYNTVFLNYKIINRSDKIYYKTYLGIFTDTDIGYPNDDYIGSDVERGFYYGYNGTPVDGNGQPGSYGANPPVQSVTFLGGPFMDPDGIDNPRIDGFGHQLCNQSVNGVNFGDSIVDNERLGLTNVMVFNNSGVPNYMLDPNLSPDYYNMLRGRWGDQTSLQYGGNGHDSTGIFGPACKFMYPGLSDTLNWGVGCVPPNGPELWNEVTAGNVPGDRRGLGSSGPFTFNPGQVEQLDIAYSFATGLGNLINITDTLRKHFVSNILNDGSSFNGTGNNLSLQKLTVQVYPNPASSRINIKLGKVVNDIVTLHLLNANGTLVQYENLNPSGKMISLDISGLSPGLYLLSVESENERVTTKISIIK